MSELNVATPATAFALFVPPSVAAPGFAASPIDTLPVKLVTTLPSRSSTVTVTGSPKIAPAVIEAGCDVKPSWFAAPVAMSNEFVVAPVSPGPDAASV